MLQTSAEGEALIYSHVLRILELYLVAAKAKETLKKEKLTEKTNCAFRYKFECHFKRVFMFSVGLVKAKMTLQYMTLYLLYYHLYSAVMCIYGGYFESQI